MIDSAVDQRCGQKEPLNARGGELFKVLDRGLTVLSGLCFLIAFFERFGGGCVARYVTDNKQITGV